MKKRSGSENRKRQRNLSVRITNKEFEKLSRDAEKKGMSIGQYIRYFIPGVK